MKLNLILEFLVLTAAGYALIVMGNYQLAICGYLVAIYMQNNRHHKEV